MQSLGHACIFSYSIPNAFNVFLASYIDNDNSFFRGNISPNNFNSIEKLLSDHPYLAFRLYNLINADNLVKFLQPGYKGLSASSSNLSNNFGLSLQSSYAASTISIVTP